MAPTASPSPPRVTKPPLWSLPFVLLLGIQFTYGMAFSSFFVLPKYLIEVRAASSSLVGNAHGAFALCGALAVPFVGVIADRWGRRRVLIAGLILAVITFAPVGWTAAPGALLFLRALHGISFSMVFASGGTLAVDLAPPSRRAEAVGYFGTAMLVTNALGPLLAEWLARHGDWSTVFWACSLHAAVALLAALRLRAPEYARSTELSNPVPMSVPLAGAYLASLGLGLGVGASQTFVPAALVAEGASHVGPYFAAYTLGAVAQRTFLGFLADRMGRLSATIVSLLVYAASLVAVALSFGFWLLALALLVGAAHGLAYPASAALSIDCCQPEARGRVTAISTGCFNLGFALGTSGLAPFEPWLGYRGLAILGAVAVAICAGGVQWLTPRPGGVARTLDGVSDR